MNREIIKRNAFWLAISTRITLIVAIPVSLQKKNTLINKACAALPSKTECHEQEITILVNYHLKMQN